MQITAAPQSVKYAQAIATLVEKMPPARAAEVYDFALFLSDKPVPTPIADENDDWLNDSEEQMQAEDAAWEKTYTQHRERFNVLADAARAEIAAGKTQPMFDEKGETTL
ncbi:MAG TPA: hypothetical protein PKH77_15160 [Anaerolineae bacterium]|nr:hypothetical protein [Anaerolineae bacterium]